MSERAVDTETLTQLYAALNRNDIPALMTFFDPEIEWRDPGATPEVGTYRGFDTVKAHFSQARNTWAEGACAPERFLVGSDKIVALVHVRVRVEGETEWREGRLADVYTFRNGRVVQGRCFVDRNEALIWAGIAPQL